ncbi:cytochrome c oxidase assembly protein [Cellulomonas sp. SG140]|uniref:cytochrome c oxidase assembly protein n=1 Tax=Cellulomonas sp. SG140 TaxID=2976536 RepID=UPI0021E78F95|nr:cytochrome c oxidase assembly protein [Cellulomonas sp. SG140]
MNPGPLTTASALGSWQVDVPALVLVVLAGAGYLVGVRAVRRAGTVWSPLRSTAFLAGLVLVIASTCWFVGVYAHVLFWVFTLQVCLLLLVAPLLLGVGAPVALVAAVRGRGAVVDDDEAPASRRPLLLRVLGAPGVGPLLLILVTVLVFFTPLLGAALRHPPVFHSVHLLLLAAGLVLALPVTDEGMTLSSLGYAALIGLGFLEFLLDAIPGIALRLHGSLLAPEYWSVLHRGWGPAPLDDQHQAGGMLWFFGEAADLPFLVIAMIAWIRADAREADRIDRALDLVSAEPASAATGAPTTAVPAGEGDPPVGATAPTLDRPWWETDAGVFGEERARRYGWTTREGQGGAQGPS